MSAYAGVRVVDFTQGVAGPKAAMMLADFGAEVIKVEPPEGDWAQDHPGYLTWNRGKQLLTLNLHLAEAKETARELIAAADVVMLDARPGLMEPIGLDAATLCARHPGLIHVWMPPYGTGSLWSHLPPRHCLLMGLTGIAFRQGAYRDQPICHVTPLAWYAQATIAAAAIGASLLERKASGQGQSLVVSGLHGAAELSGPARIAGMAPLPRGRPLGSSPSYRCYRCADGRWLFLGTLFAPFFRRAVEAMVPEALEDQAALLDIGERLEAAFASKPRDAWIETLRAHDVPCGPVGDRATWFASKTVAANGMRVELEHPRLGRVSTPGIPVKLMQTPGEIGALMRPFEGPPPPRPAVEPAAASTAPPLVGVRVLDLGTVIAGAYASSLLASFGGDVVKIEPPEADPFRGYGVGFLSYNRGKRGLGLDLKRPGAREVFLEMARQADVVIDNYRPGVRAKLGIDYAALKAVNPRIISCSIHAYGQGPQAGLPGFDPLLQAESGLMAAQGGGADEEPILHTIPVNDVASAAVVLFGVIAALNARERTGEGQEIATSLAAQSVYFQSGEITEVGGRAQSPLGAPDCLGIRALEGYYACADGWIGIACQRAEEAAGLGLALGLPMEGEAALEALAAPRQGPLAEAIAAALARRPRLEALQALLASGVAAAPVLRAAEAFSSEWLWANGWFDVWEQPGLGQMQGMRNFADWSRTPAGHTRPAPEIAADTTEVLAELGMAPERIAELLAAGAVFDLGLGGVEIGRGGEANAILAS